MSTPTPTTTAAPVVAAEVPVTEADLDDSRPLDLAGARRLRREAARHRTAAKEAQERVEALSARVEAHDRADVLRMAEAAAFVRAEDVFDLGFIDLAAVRDDSGALDVEVVTAALAAAAAERPHLVDRGSAHFDQGAQTPAPSTEPVSWSTAMRPAW